MHLHRLHRRPLFRSFSTVIVGCACVLLVMSHATITYHSMTAPSPSSSATSHSGRLAEDDDNPIHIVQAFCIDNGFDATDPGLTAMRSILAARAAGASPNRRYVFHLIVDEASGCADCTSGLCLIRNTHIVICLIFYSGLGGFFRSTAQWICRGGRC